MKHVAPISKNYMVQQLLLQGNEDQNMRNKIKWKSMMVLMKCVHGLRLNVLSLHFSFFSKPEKTQAMQVEALFSV